MPANTSKRWTMDAGRLCSTGAAMASLDPTLNGRPSLTPPGSAWSRSNVMTICLPHRVAGLKLKSSVLTHTHLQTQHTYRHILIFREDDMGRLTKPLYFCYNLFLKFSKRVLKLHLQMVLEGKIRKSML